MKKDTCETCSFYKKDMCIHKKPNITKKPFGFPFKYDKNQLNCQSWKKRTIDDDINWEHL